MAGIPETGHESRQEMLEGRLNISSSFNMYRLDAASTPIKPGEVLKPGEGHRVVNRIESLGNLRHSRMVFELSYDYSPQNTGSDADDIANMRVAVQVEDGRLRPQSSNSILAHDENPRSTAMGVITDQNYRHFFPDSQREQQQASHGMFYLKRALAANEKGWLAEAANFSKGRHAVPLAERIHSDGFPPYEGGLWTMLCEQDEPTASGMVADLLIAALNEANNDYLNLTRDARRRSGSRELLGTFPEDASYILPEALIRGVFAASLERMLRENMRTHKPAWFDPDALDRTEIVADKPVQPLFELEPDRAEMLYQDNEFAGAGVETVKGVNPVTLMSNEMRSRLSDAADAILRYNDIGHGIFTAEPLSHAFHWVEYHHGAGFNQAVSCEVADPADPLLRIALIMKMQELSRAAAELKAQSEDAYRKSDLRFFAHLGHNAWNYASQALIGLAQIWDTVVSRRPYAVVADRPDMQMRGLTKRDQAFFVGYLGSETFLHRNEMTGGTEDTFMRNILLTAQVENPNDITKLLPSGEE